VNEFDLRAAKAAADASALREKAIAQIRDALATLSYCSDGHFEDEAHAALDALDWIEAWS
jgi:hypothetical protein